MKKLLVMLMVVAMASFLFVGCLGTTPPIDPDEPDEPVLPPSVTPVIETIVSVADDTLDINLYTSATQYMNKTFVADGILVTGYAPKYSEVNIYVGGAVVGTSTAYGGDEEFTVFVAKADLGTDGAKTLYATATELGFAESVPSTVYAFTLDVVAPKIVSITGEVEGFDVDDRATQTITCSEAIKEGSLVLDLEDSVLSNPVENANGIWDITVILPSDFSDFSPPDGSNNPEEDDHFNIKADSFQYDLVAPEVIELSGEFAVSYIGTLGDVGTLIRVSYEISEPEEPPPTGYDYIPITDLAGNGLVESVHYCYLEVED